MTPTEYPDNHQPSQSSISSDRWYWMPQSHIWQPLLIWRVVRIGGCLAVMAQCSRLKPEVSWVWFLLTHVTAGLSSFLYFHLVRSKFLYWKQINYLVLWELILGNFANYLKGSGIASIPEVCIDMYEFFCNAWMHVAEIYRHLQSEDFSLMGNPLRVWLSSKVSIIAPCK